MLALIQKYWVVVLAASLLGNVVTTTIIVRERTGEQKTDCPSPQAQKKQYKRWERGDAKVIFGDSQKF